MLVRYLTIPHPKHDTLSLVIEGYKPKVTECSKLFVDTCPFNSGRILLYIED